MANSVKLIQEFNELQEQYQTEMEKLKPQWLRKNNSFKNHPDCYEVMREHDRKDVDGVIKSFEAYMTPIAEEWWKKRGWKLHWPTESESRCMYTKLEK